MKRVLALALVGVLAAVAGCGKSGDVPMDTSREQFSENDSFWVMYNPDPDPIPVGDDFSMMVMVHDGADQSTLLTDATIDVSAWMPAMGHGMPNPPTVTANGDGTFMVSGMNFIMGGHWVIHIEVTDNGTTEMADFNVMADDGGSM